MCFLKNVNQRPSFAPPSAFKKVEAEPIVPSEPSVESASENSKSQKEGSSTVLETVECSPEQDFTPAQTLQLQWLMNFIQTNNSVVHTLIQVLDDLIQRNQEMETNLSALTSELQELKKALASTPSKKL